MRLLRIGAALTVLGLATMILLFLRLEKRRAAEPLGGYRLAMSLDIPLFPESASTMSGQVDALYLFLVALSAFFTLLIAASVIYCAVRFRRRSPDEIGGTFHANLAARADLDHHPARHRHLPLLLGRAGLLGQFRPPADAVESPPSASSGCGTSSTPTAAARSTPCTCRSGSRSRSRLISQDVIHSLFFPAFRTKTDVLPGRYTSLWFEATKPGTYHIFCAEYCGAEHSKMIGSVVAMEAGAYEQWLAGGEGPRVPPAEAGKLLFTQLTCNTCHEGDNPRGPSLVGIHGRTVSLADGSTVVADDAYLRESILQPNAKLVAGYQPLMPTYQGQVSEETVFKLVSYIKSLGSSPDGAQAPAGATGTAPGAPADPAPEETR
jgi:cytochrome c oxidase subunit II